MKKRFEEFYKSGGMPWDLGHPDSNLIKSIEKFGVNPCKALDIGCGTGDTVLWLTKMGFEATGIDFSEHAIELATQKKPRQKSFIFIFRS